MEPNYTLQTVERALSFLEYVAQASAPPTVRDISAALDLNITTCYHLLRTLAARDYILRDEEGRIELGESVGILASGFRRSQDIDQALAHLVRRLSATTLETAVLSIREGDSVVLKVLAEGSQRLRVAGLFVGMKGGEHRRATGKAVLAHLDEDERSAMLASALSNIAPRERKATLSSLKPEFATIKARGWSTDERPDDGIISIGAPIFDRAGKVYGAVGIVVPTMRMERSQHAFLQAVREAAAEADRLFKGVGAN